MKKHLEKSDKIEEDSKPFSLFDNFGNVILRRTICMRCKKESDKLVEAFCLSCRDYFKRLVQKELEEERERLAEERGSRHIPLHIQNKVWIRDGGKCVKCGSEKFLEYHHKVAFAKGGKHTVENIELLCYLCHRIDPEMILFGRKGK